MGILTWSVDWLWRISGSYLEGVMGLFFVGDSIEIIYCPRSPWSPGDSISWGEDGSITTHCHEGTVCVRDSNEIVCCSRSPWSPSDSIRRGEDGLSSDLSSNCHEGTVSVGDIMEILRCSRSSIVPRCSIRRGVKVAHQIGLEPITYWLEVSWLRLS